MKVKDLIAALSKYDENADVAIGTGYKYLDIVYAERVDNWLQAQPIIRTSAEKVDDQIPTISQLFRCEASSPISEYTVDRALASCDEYSEEVEDLKEKLVEVSWYFEKYSSIEILTLWEKWSNRCSARFLSVTDKTISDFIDWLNIYKEV